MSIEVVADTTPDAGNYFVSNYPPFSAWSPQHVPAAIEALDTPVTNGRHTDPQALASANAAQGEAALSHATQPSPLGLYLHIPFCRQRCKFCYFRVYTDKNSNDVEAYLNALARETELYAERAALRDRPFEFVYFGGGTPSFLSSEQLQRLIDRISKHWPWDNVRELTFECEPGTFSKRKLETIKAIGTTRLSLGFEHFDDEILSLNGRGHNSSEVFQAYDLAREVGFEQINIDLIAGMLGDTESKWKAAVAQAVELAPDSVTIYQMELPHNTVIWREAKDLGQAPAVAGPQIRRAWVDYAFREFEQAGYRVSSAYTLVKGTGIGRGCAGDEEALNRAPGASPVTRDTAAGRMDFVYRDSLWHGADMIGTGVASFSHLAGVHFQNSNRWDEYVGSLERGNLPIGRAFPASGHQKLVRELILQLKLGRLNIGYFRRKFGVEITEVFAKAFDSLVSEALGTINGDEVRLTRAGLLCVDELLSRFYEPQFRNIRYT